MMNSSCLLKKLVEDTIQTVAFLLMDFGSGRESEP